MRVFVENEFGEQARLGDDAHVWAYSPDGPRGQDEGAPADPNDRRNIILLCKNCHTEVDSQPCKFTTDVLTAMRETHYQWADDALGQAKVEKPRFHYILYLNLVRLDMYAVANSIAPPTLHFGAANSFSELGFDAGRIMASYTGILNTEDMYAHQVADCDAIADLYVGQYCFLNRVNFRTRGIGRSELLEAAWAGDESVIYRQYGDWCLLCLIDPRWITTSTAGSTLRSGHATLCGVVRINRVDSDTRKVYASPLFLAQA